MTIRNDQLLTPKLADLMQSMRLDIFRSMNCVKPGQISSFNPTKKTAEVKVLFKRVLPSGETAEYPLLVDCPVVTMQGGGAALQLPISAGDQCLLFFSDRNIDNWFQTGAEFPPANSRAHDISDGFALVGVNALNSTMPAYPTDKARLVMGEAEISVKGGKVGIAGAGGTLLAALEGILDVLKALTIQDPVSGPIPLTAASIAALEAQKAILEGVLNS